MTRHEESHDGPGYDHTRRRFLSAIGAAGVAATIGGTALAQDDEEPAETFVMGGRVEAWQAVAPDSIAGEDNPTLELTPDETYVFVWENLDGQPHNFAIHDENDEGLPVLEEIEVPEDVPVPSEELGTPEGTPTPTPEGTPTPSPTPSPTPTPEGTPTPTPEGTPEEGTPTPELLDVTETISEEGAMQAVQFTATEEMVTYICEIHPNTMVGDVSLGEGDGTPEEGDGTPTPTPEEGDGTPTPTPEDGG